MTDLPMKVRYGTLQTAAYLTQQLDDGTHVGTDKHTDLPVHLRWTGDKWVEVCRRTFAVDDLYNETWREVGPRPTCSCNT